MDGIWKHDKMLQNFKHALQSYCTIDTSADVLHVFTYIDMDKCLSISFTFRIT